MKRLLIIFIIAIIAGCAGGPVEPIDQPPVDPPVTPPVEPPVEPPVDPPVEVIPEDTPADPTEPVINETVDPVEIEDPQLDPRATVETYLKLMTRALDGEDEAYEEAYKLISPHSTKNLHWMGSLDAFHDNF